MDVAAWYVRGSPENTAALLATDEPVSSRGVGGWEAYGSTAAVSPTTGSWPPRNVPPNPSDSVSSSSTQRTVTGAGGAGGATRTNAGAAASVEWVVDGGGVAPCEGAASAGHFGVRRRGRRVGARSAMAVAASSTAPVDFADAGASSVVARVRGTAGAAAASPPRASSTASRKMDVLLMYSSMGLRWLLLTLALSALLRSSVGGRAEEESELESRGRREKESPGAVETVAAPPASGEQLSTWEASCDACCFCAVRRRLQADLPMQCGHFKPDLRCTKSSRTLPHTTQKAKEPLLTAVLGNPPTRDALSIAFIDVQIR